MSGKQNVAEKRRKKEKRIRGTFSVSRERKRENKKLDENYICALQF